MNFLLHLRLAKNFRVNEHDNEEGKKFYDSVSKIASRIKNYYKFRRWRPKFRPIQIQNDWNSKFNELSNGQMYGNFKRVVRIIDENWE